MGYGLLFAGQGSQRPDMLPWLEREPGCAALLAALDATLGSDWRAHLTDRHWAWSNRVAQPLIVGTALAAWSALSPRLGRPPVGVAGYSVGELAAYAAAGACTPALALSLADQRALLMDEAVRGLSTGLLSIARAGEADVLARSPGLEVAIRIDVDHAVYAGTATLLAAAERELAELASCKRIDVALASHSSYMRDAAAGFARALTGVDFRSPACPVATNATGSATRDPHLLRRALAHQIDHPVEWQDCMAALAERGPRCVLEIGPGQALARMWSAQHPHIPVRSIEDFRDVEGAVAWVSRHAHAPS
jgi:[acyl-carrier-protein] S-malonyltransferase